MKSFVSVILAQILWQFFRKIKMLFSRNLSLISRKKDSKKATFIWLLLNKFQNASNKILYNLKMYNWSDWRQNSWSIIGLRISIQASLGLRFQLEHIRFSIGSLKQPETRGFKFTKCLITSPSFESQKCNAPFWKWQKNRVQMV